LLLVQLHLSAVLGGLLEDRAEGGVLPHAGLGAPLLAVDALWVLAARHLDRARRSKEVDVLCVTARAHLDDVPLAADEVGRPRGGLGGGDPPGGGPGDGGVLRPVAVAGGDVGGHRGDRLIAVAGRVYPRGGVDADVRVGVDDPWGDEAALGVDLYCATRR